MVPKRLIEACNLIRAGSVNKGLKALDSFQNLETEIAEIKSEIMYFSCDFEKAMEYEKIVFPYWGKWCTHHLFHEHLAAFTFAAINTGKNKDAAAFLAMSIPNVQSKLQNYNLSDSLREIFILQILESIDVLENGIERYIDEHSYKQNYKIKSMDEITRKLENRFPHIKKDSANGISYMLNQFYKEGLARDFIELYEKCTQGRRHYHINAAKIYLSLNQRDKAEQAIRNFAQAWCPYGYLTVMPMTLFTEYGLYSLLTPIFLNELMTIPKHQFE